MAINEKYPLSLKISDCSFSEIQSLIERNASLLLPVGSLEPVGETLALGAVNTCCMQVTETLSCRLQIPVAPLFAYAYNTPFKSFAGCSGVRGPTLMKVIIDCCNSWLFHGFERIIIITLMMEGQEGLHNAVSRINAWHGNKITFIPLQEETFFRSFCQSRFGGRELGRSEWAIHALVSYLCPELRKASRCTKKNTLPNEHVFKRWNKCGRDPEKLKKMVPAATLSDIYLAPDASAGKELFECMLTNLTEKITRF